jgi:phage tail-like protein
MSNRHALFKVSGPTLDRDEITVTEAGFQVGRSGDNDLALPHSEISRRHMRIYLHEGGFAVEDQKSSNGVWVNDVRIRTQTPHPIKPGDVIRAGPFLFNFDRIVEVESEPSAAPAPPAPEEKAPPVEHKTEPPPAEAAEEKAPETDGSKEPPAKKPSKRKEEKPAEPVAEPEPIQPVEKIDLGAFIPQREGDGLARAGMPSDLALPPLEANGHVTHPIGVPTDASNWLKYLPAIYSDDNFVGRYLLIFESILSPISWMVDNFDMYLSSEVAPPEWLRWISSWFDVLLVPELPIDRQRAVVEQLGWLFFRRGTKVGLERLLTLYFGTKPEITENDECHFTVKLYLSESNVKLDHDIVNRMIMAHKPVHASYTLEIL